MSSGCRGFLAATLCVGLLANVASAQQPAASKPNIVFILADDAGVGDFGCYGGKGPATPNVDRLAAEGMRFTNAYSGSAVCAPTRCVLMTGLHTGHCLRRANQSKHGLLSLPADTVTLARLLKQGGYATGGFGKWGLGNEGTTGAAEKQGFDVFYGYYDQVHAHDYFPAELVRNGKREALPGNAGGKRGQYSHSLILDETLRFIEANKDRPFFAYACWTLPHGDFDVPEVAPEFAAKGWKPPVQKAATMIKLLDDGVGAVLRKLKDLGLDQQTIVVFSSDNGAQHPGRLVWNSTAGLRDFKRSLHEGGVRAPFVVRWPGRVAPSSTSDVLTSHVDFLATAAELAGALAPRSDGLSLAPTFLGKGGDLSRRTLYWEIYEGPAPFQQAIRQGPWKAYRLGTREKMELYDLKADPAESRNVAGEHAEVVNEMEAIFAREHVPSPHYDALEYHRPKAKAKKKQKD